MSEADTNEDMMMTFDEFCDALKNVDVDSQESIS
jgi:hypothetical protein